MIMNYRGLLFIRKRRQEVSGEIKARNFNVFKLYKRIFPKTFIKRKKMAIKPFSVY